MKSYILPQQVADVADAVYRRTDEVSILLASCNHPARCDSTGLTAAVPFDVVAAGLCGQHASDLRGDRRRWRFQRGPRPSRLGIERARDGVPLSSVMEAYRVGFRRVWDEGSRRGADPARA